MGESDFSLFEWHFGRREPEPEVDRVATGEPGERPARRGRRRDRDGGDGSTLGTVLVGGGAIAVVGAIAGGIWYALRRRGDSGDDGAGGKSRVPAARGVPGTAANARATARDRGTASLVGLAFLIATSVLVGRYLRREDESAEAVADSVADADDVTVLTDRTERQ
jgi:hypothetical protein